MTYTSYTSKIRTWLERHPWIGLPVHAITFLFHYITSFRWVIDIVRWMVTTAGNVAESAFLLATVYVTTNTVAHLLVTWILPDHLISTLNQVSTMAFSVLPELIIASAMKTTFDHWKLVWRSRRVDAWIWACSYTIPTIVFLVMTILTISTFVNFEAVNATPPQATGLMLVTRCLAGWGYGMVQILFVSIGKQGYVDTLDDLHTQVHTRDEALASRAQVIDTLQKDMATLQDQMTQQERALFEAQMALATRRMSRSPMHVAKSPIGITPIRQGAKSGRKTTQLLDSSTQSSGLDSRHMSPQTLESNAQSSVYNSGLHSEQSLDSTVYSNVHKTRLDNEQSVDTGTQSSGLDSRHMSPQTLESSVYKSTHKSGLESEQSLDSSVQSTVQSNGFRREQLGDSTVLSSVHKTGHMSPQVSDKTVSSTVHKNKTDSSEAAKKIQRILRRNPNTGPTELAAKTGVSRSYASLIKSQFLTALAAEQSA